MPLLQHFPILLRRRLKRCLPALLCLNIGLAGAAEAVDHWYVCAKPALLKKQLPDIASRIADRVAQGEELIRVGGVPVGPGSLEFRLAGTAEIFERLRDLLQAMHVPRRRVAFEWLTSADVGPDSGSGPNPVDCPRAAVLVMIYSVGP